jgi:hypothetical protein
VYHDTRGSLATYHVHAVDYLTRVLIHVSDSLTRILLYTRPNVHLATLGSNTRGTCRQ